MIILKYFHFFIAVVLALYVARSLAGGLLENSRQEGNGDRTGRTLAATVLLFLLLAVVCEVLGFELHRLMPLALTGVLLVMAVVCRISFLRGFNGDRGSGFSFRMLPKPGAFEAPVAALVIAFLLLELGFLFSPKPIFDVADALFYHVPRMLEWYQRGAITWIDTPGFRLNSFPRLMAVLGAMGLLYTDSMRVALLPSLVASLFLLWNSVWLLSRLVLKDGKVLKAASGGWLVLAGILSTAPVFLQLRAFQVDHVQLGILSAFIALRVWRGPSRLRLVGCLAALALALGNKATGLPFLPVGVLILLTDPEIRKQMWNNPKLSFGFAVGFAVSVGIFLIPFGENWVRNGNPLYPFPLVLGPLHFPGGVGWGGEDHISPGLSNFLACWKFFFISLFSLGDFSVVAADVGGYGPGFRLLAGPVLLGWLVALFKSSTVRKVSIIAVLFCSINMLPRSYGRDGHPEARYYAILLLPLLLGAIHSLDSLLNQVRPMTRRAVSGLTTLVIFYSFFKVASVPHASWVRDVAGLPGSLIQSLRSETPIERKLRVLAVGIGSRVFTGGLYGSSYQHHVRTRGVPVDDLTYRFPSVPTELVRLCELDAPGFVEEAREFDVIVFDQFVLPEVMSCYRQALIRAGWQFYLSSSPPVSYGLRGVANYAARLGLPLN